MNKKILLFALEAGEALATPPETKRNSKSLNQLPHSYSIPWLHSILFLLLLMLTPGNITLSTYNKVSHTC